VLEPPAAASPPRPAAAAESTSPLQEAAKDAPGSHPSLNLSGHPELQMRDRDLPSQFQNLARFYRDPRTLTRFLLTRMPMQLDELIKVKANEPAKGLLSKLFPSQQLPQTILDGISDLRVMCTSLSEKYQELTTTDTLKPNQILPSLNCCEVLLLYLKPVLENLKAQNFHKHPVFDQLQTLQTDLTQITRKLRTLPDYQTEIETVTNAPKAPPSPAVTLLR
jgi:hypothetical protein